MAEVAAAATASALNSKKVGASGGGVRVRARYDTHLPALTLRYGENSQTLLVWMDLPTLHGHVLCNIFHLCGVCWENCKRKKSHVFTPPPVGGDRHYRADENSPGGLT